MVEGPEETFGKELNKAGEADESSKVSVLAITGLNRDVSGA